MSKSVFEIKLPCPPPRITDIEALQKLVSAQLGTEDTVIVHEETQSMGSPSAGSEVYLLTFRSENKPVFVRALTNSYVGHIQNLVVTLP